MTQTIKLNEHIYFLLIEKNLDHFTVTSLRDELLRCSSIYNDPLEARLLVYKQICRLSKKNLLVRDNNRSPMRVIYSKSALFKSTDFVKTIKKHRIDDVTLNTKKVNQETQFNIDLQVIKNRYDAEMVIIKGELAEYQDLMRVYPHKSEAILLLLKDANLHLLSMKGKLAALKKLKI
ncbi:MAG: hypothetical protein ACI9LM_004531 [Alteromonadaceae bacterium]|jgi:hypothetical protein